MDCEFCSALSRKKCPAKRKSALTHKDINSLCKTTPFGAWQTPAQIAETFNYTTKHVVRLAYAHDKQIASVQEDGRHYILRCSFEQFLENR